MEQAASSSDVQEYCGLDLDRDTVFLSSSGKTLAQYFKLPDDRFFPSGLRGAVPRFTRLFNAWCLIKYSV
jgi:hypothetical protein